MPTDALADHAPASNPAAISKIEPTKILDLVISKQTHYYSLWAVYTAVQFAAASFGLGQRLVPQASDVPENLPAARVLGEPLFARERSVLRGNPNTLVEERNADAVTRQPIGRADAMLLQQIGIEPSCFDGFDVPRAERSQDRGARRTIRSGGSARPPRRG